MIKLWLSPLAILLLLTPSPATTTTNSFLFDIANAVDSISLCREIVDGVFSSWTILDEFQHDTEDPDFGEVGMRRVERKLLQRLGQLSRKIDAVDRRVELVTATVVAEVTKQTRRDCLLETRLDRLSIGLRRIGDASRVFREYTKAIEGGKTIEQRTLEDFAGWSVGQQAGGVQDVLEDIHALIVPPEGGLFDRGVLGLLLISLEEASITACSLRQSPQQTIYQLYTAVALAELRGYSMMQFSYMLLKLYNKGNFTLETQLMRTRYEERLTATAKAARSAMENASRDLWRCDPDRHEEGHTYLEVTRLLQGFVENEVNLNTENTCKETCSFYKYAQVEGCYKEGYCSQQPKCNGKVLKCQYIDSDMWICPSNYNGSNRRYDWIEYENGRQLGRVGSCPQPTAKVDSWWRWLFWHCSYCLCICDEQSPKSDRYFNLREAVADTASNMVVTGLRFVRKNRVIHLQIQEAALLPQGNINSSSLRWKPVDDYKITSENVQQGVDYHTMTWDKRAMDLDDLIVPIGYVVTGIRFRMVGTHLNLEIQGSAMNFTSGELDDPHVKSHWISNDNTDASLTKPRTRLQLRNPDVSTRTRTPSFIDSRSDQYVMFTHSDIDTDAAQTTVPFLDAQDATPAAPVPLAGAGLYHKGQKGFGGFVGPKLITYDYSKHIYVEFPEESPTVTVR